MLIAFILIGLLLLGLLLVLFCPLVLRINTQQNLYQLRWGIARAQFILTGDDGMLLLKKYPNKPLLNWSIFGLLFNLDGQ